MIPAAGKRIICPAGQLYPCYRCRTINLYLLYLGRKTEEFFLSIFGISPYTEIISSFLYIFEGNLCSVFIFKSIFLNTGNRLSYLFIIPITIKKCCFRFDSKHIIVCICIFVSVFQSYRYCWTIYSNFTDFRLSRCIYFNRYFFRRSPYCPCFIFFQTTDSDIIISSFQQVWDFRNSTLCIKSSYPWFPCWN